MFIRQLELLDGRVSDVKKRRSTKRKKRNNTQDVTQDVLTQQAEEEQTEPWSRSGSSVEVDSGLRDELRNLFLDDANSLSHNLMTKYFTEQSSNNGILASYTTFNTFMKGERKTALKVQHRKAFLEYIASKSCSVPSSSTSTPANTKNDDSDGGDSDIDNCNGDNCNGDNCNDDDSDGSKHDNSNYYGDYHKVCTMWRGEEEKWLASQNGRQEED